MLVHRPLDNGAPELHGDSPTVVAQECPLDANGLGHQTPR